MHPVDTTVFITPASTRPGLEVARCAEVPGWWRALVVLLCGVLFWGAVFARTPAVLQSELQRDADTLNLSARVDLVAPAAVQDALLKGVPMYFVWRAEVYRDRWYWSDKRVSTQTRTLRLAYQPLTRRWRLSVASDPGAASSGAGGLRYALHQNFDELGDVLAVIGRVARWPIADAAHMDRSDRYRVEWSFRLELSLLPRPFQIGMANDPDWNIGVERGLDAPADAAEEDAPPAVAPPSTALPPPAPVAVEAAPLADAIR
ncbi:DUF4390 domain-containing protein [Hydrogenophaga sp. PAMC20947]|nr:DUF4390 domain-containing protein [Hydrogenophaga sp. PAMC20947]